MFDAKTIIKLTALQTKSFINNHIAKLISFLIISQSSCREAHFSMLNAQCSMLDAI